VSSSDESRCVECGGLLTTIGCVNLVCSRGRANVTPAQPWNLRATPDGLDERKIFIRATAAGIAVRHPERPPEFIWSYVRSLWDAKPDDC
jgi:hypothetical protein